MTEDVFLARAGWSGAARADLTPDASARSYQRLTRGLDTAILMRDPTGGIPVFDRLARHLLAQGFSAPRILASDAEAGLMLIEDLGDALLARVCAAQPAQEPALYAAAAGLLAALHETDPAPDLVRATPDWLAAMLAPLFDAYLPAAGAEVPPTDRDALEGALCAALTGHGGAPDVMVLRDYHAENLLWLPDRQGDRCIGLLDFQDALIGPRAYDLVSLVQDARRDVSPAATRAAHRAFLERSGQSEALLLPALAVLGVQRNLRILGIFVRLAQDRGKPGYLRLIPRVWDHVQAGLAHPALARVAPLAARVLPPPSALGIGARA